MKLKTVRVGGFGPLRGQKLSLAPGLTVIWGPNEAGKSAWHAACYVALCGLRRARGRLRRDDAVFAERHQPWDGGDWGLEAVVTRDSGSPVDVQWDLASRLGRAEDTRGREITNQFLFDGGLDLSVAMGLDRDSFLVTCCVRQADVLAILENPGLLQQHLQRAAATGGKDATAAAALAAIERFQKEQVGSDRANATKPLRTAIVRLQRAQELHHEAERLHAERLEMVADRQRAERATELTSQALLIVRQVRATAQLRAEVEAALQADVERTDLRRNVIALSQALDQLGHCIELTGAVGDLRRAETKLHREQALAAEQDAVAETLRKAQVKAEAAARQVRLAEAAKAHRAHADASGRLERAEALSKRPAGRPPPLEDEDQLAQDAASALRAWQERPEPLNLSGPTSNDLVTALAALPAPPNGDLEPRPEVAEACSKWAAARQRLALHDDARPTEPPFAEEVERELRGLAEALDAPRPEDGLIGEIAAARSTHTTLRRDTRTRTLMIFSVVLLAAGVGAAAVGIPVLGGLLIISAIASAVISRTLLPVATHSDAPRRVAELTASRGLADRQGRPRYEAAQRAAELGLVAESGALRASADDSATSRRALTKWIELRAALTAAVRDVEEDLASALQAANVDVTADLAYALDAYEEACRQRCRQADAASRRPNLEQQLSDRRTMEAATIAGDRSRKAAEDALVASAAACGLGAPRPEEAAEKLAAWLAHRPERLQSLQRVRDEQHELADLLAGETLADLAELADRLAADAAAALGEDLVLPVDEESLAVLADGLPKFFETRQTRAEAAATAQAQHDERCRIPAQVDAAEQEVVDATDRLASLQRLHPDAATGTDLSQDQDAVTMRLQVLTEERAATEEQLIRLQGQTEEQTRRPKADTGKAAQRFAEAKNRLAELCALYPEAADEIHDLGGLGEFDAEALGDRISELEGHLEEQAKEAAELRGKLDERSRQEPDIAAAEETVVEARDELQRVRQLEGTLKLTHQFLAEAQDRVHHDIAPRLAESAGRWLPTVFGGRYDKVRIDPADLAVRTAARDGQLREATALSHGTAEQLYLLLRVALVEELTRGAKETCPLLLDDITAHFDDQRADGVLRMLHELSGERQVVLFTQESRVKDWARRMVGPDDTVLELASPGEGKPQL